jgi:hypothetical protein
MLLVAVFAAVTAFVLIATIRSTFKATSSRANLS